jgi:acetylornithine deacetylase
MASPEEELSRLVAFPSVSHRAMRDLAAYVAGRFEDLGATAALWDDETDPGKCSVVACIGPEADGGLTLSGHLDVVPTDGQPWSSDPFAMTARGERLVGRGTADMKGFLAATLCALQGLDRAAMRAPLWLVWTHDEEVGCFGSAQIARRMVASGQRLPDACWIGEPTEFAVLRMHPGHVAVEVEVTGLAAHSSRPGLGRNAIVRAVGVVTAALEVASALESERPAGASSPWVPINVATIEGGSAINIVPDRCVIRIGYRPPPGMDAELPFQRLERILDATLPATLDGANLPSHTAKILRITPSLLTAADVPLRKMLRPYEVPGESEMATFATDGGNLVKAGAKPLVFGPGSISVAHKADEYLLRSDLLRAVDVVREVVRTAVSIA